MGERLLTLFIAFACAVILFCFCSCAGLVLFSFDRGGRMNQWIDLDPPAPETSPAKR